jgi:large subunit ribosomal protein L4
MIELAIYNKEGKQVDQIQIDESLLGRRVRPALLKQAIVMYQANQRQGTVATRSRGMVEGSTRKLYKQKGTGNARMGPIRAPQRKGGGMAFAKSPRDFRQSMPQKQRQLARNSAILGKIQSHDAIVIDQLNFEAPKTKEFATILGNLKIDRTCLVALEDYNQNVYKSLRNIPGIDAVRVDQLNAGDICKRRKLLFTRAAIESLLKSGAAAGDQQPQ